MKTIAITQTKSGIGRPGKHKKIIMGLGLRKIGHTVIRKATPETMGMVRKIQHLIKIEEIEMDNVEGDNET